MMGFTADGQLKTEMLQNRDKKLGINSNDVRNAREDLARSAPQPVPGADAWKNETTQQLSLSQTALRNKR
jgi:hypothetical protein